MAIRDRFRRALRKSDSSDTISQAESSSTTASSTRRNSSDETAPQLQLHKTTSTLALAKTFTFGHRSKTDKDLEKKKAKEAEKERRRNKNKATYRHPSEKPLTEQNLKHQEMFSQYTMTFGTANVSQVEDIHLGGVSPCCTRPCSIDGGPRS